MARSRSGLGRTTRVARAFTVVELLVVMAIILILAGLVLGTSSYVHNKGARSRAEAEIAAMSAALENYKADNGIYPNDATLNAQTDTNPVNYQPVSLTLYKAISGDQDNDADRSAEVTSYLSFKPSQLSPVPVNPATQQPQKVDFIKDPFGNSYGYSTKYQADIVAGHNPPGGYNPTFDLWSTANSSTQAGWIKNW